eukprot:449505-Hanusia_phi.AAC.1
MPDLIRRGLAIGGRPAEPESLSLESYSDDRRTVQNSENKKPQPGSDTVRRSDHTVPLKSTSQSQVAAPDPNRSTFGPGH